MDSPPTKSREELLEKLRHATPAERAAWLASEAVANLREAARQAAEGVGSNVGRPLPD
jgi:hypothetical protein